MPQATALSYAAVRRVNRAAREVPRVGGEVQIAVEPTSCAQPFTDQQQDAVFIAAEVV